MMSVLKICGKTLMVLLVLVTPDAIAFPSSNRIEGVPRYHYGEDEASRLMPATAYHKATVLSEHIAVRNILNALKLTAAFKSNGQHRHHRMTQHAPTSINENVHQDPGHEQKSVKPKRQSFLGIDNPDFVMRTLKLKSGRGSDEILKVLTETTEELPVEGVNLMTRERMRTRHRQRPLKHTANPLLTTDMSLQLGIEDLRRLMEKNGR